MGKKQDKFMAQYNKLDKCCQKLCGTSGKNSTKSAIVEYARTLPHEDADRLDSLRKLRNTMTHESVGEPTDADLRDLDKYLAQAQAKLNNPKGKGQHKSSSGGSKNGYSNYSPTSYSATSSSYSFYTPSYGYPSHSRSTATDIIPNPSDIPGAEKYCKAVAAWMKNKFNDMIKDCDVTEGETLELLAEKYFSQLEDLRCGPYGAHGNEDEMYKTAREFLYFCNDVTKTRKSEGSTSNATTKEATLQTLLATAKEDALRSIEETKKLLLGLIQTSFNESLNSSAKRSGLFAKRKLESERKKKEQKAEQLATEFSNKIGLAKSAKEISSLLEEATNEFEHLDRYAYIYLRKI